MSLSSGRHPWSFRSPTRICGTAFRCRPRPRAAVRRPYGVKCHGVRGAKNASRMNYAVVPDGLHTGMRLLARPGRRDVPTTCCSATSARRSPRRTETELQSWARTILSQLVCEEFNQFVHLRKIQDHLQETAVKSAICLLFRHVISHKTRFRILLIPLLTSRIPRARTSLYRGDVRSSISLASSLKFAFTARSLAKLLTLCKRTPRANTFLSFALSHRAVPLCFSSSCFLGRRREFSKYDLLPSGGRPTDCYPAGRSSPKL